MKRIHLAILVIGLLLTVTSYGQMVDTLYLNLSQAEHILLENNLSLLSEELNLDKAEAEIIQARAWPNPTLNIEGFNPYSTSYQRRHAEEQASLFGSEHFGKYRQIEIQLEQVFNLAGKRKKQRAIAEISAEEAASYLADFLLDLKLEFRKTIYEFTFQHQYLKTLKTQEKVLEELVKAYRKQYEKGNVNKMEIMRLQTFQMQLRSDRLKMETKLDSLQDELIISMNLPEGTALQFKAHELFEEASSDWSYTLAETLELTIENRPDLALSALQMERVDKEYHYEKSQRTPDVGVSINYDRGGGIYPDFVGLGLSMDLPFSNSNKGNIKKAKLQIQQSQFKHEQHLKKVQKEIQNRYKKVDNISIFLRDIEPDYLAHLDKIMKAYTRYFRERNISITAYMDFLEAYIDSQKTVFDRQQEYLEAMEELKRATGVELNRI